jgi:hypothetical protein
LEIQPPKPKYPPFRASGQDLACAVSVTAPWARLTRACSGATWPRLLDSRARNLRGSLPGSAPPVVSKTVVVRPPVPSRAVIRVRMSCCSPRSMPLLTLSGPAARKLCKRAWELFGDRRYANAWPASPYPHFDRKLQEKRQADGKRSQARHAVSLYHEMLLLYFCRPQRQLMLSSRPPAT